MATLIHQLTQTQHQKPDATAIVHKNTAWTYQELEELIQTQAQALLGTGLKPGQRVVVYLPKQIETVTSFFAISRAGGVIVPVNPVLKTAQVCHILNDCNVAILITSASRLAGLAAELTVCCNLHTIIVAEDNSPTLDTHLPQTILTWQDFLAQAKPETTMHSIIDSDMAAILYTSGSTGKPKGVVLSHRNIMTGAVSVSDYLGITAQDRILAVLPFSFDYGLNQLTTALLKGACCVLMDYLLPRDVIVTLAKEKITGLAAVPPLWAQLANLDWPEGIDSHLRYLTNSGGKMPKAVLAALREKAPLSQIFLMYGLTEAFRSTYLPPDQLDIRPDSIGKAIPNAEILVVRADGTPCAPNEPGELVHRGSLVALGYWNDTMLTAERFKPSPTQLSELPLTEIAVWSGDTVTKDEEGFLYFVGRKDDMIKTSGYRVSPTEIEEVVYASGWVQEAAAIGIAHEALGQAVVLVVSPKDLATFDEKALLNLCKAKLPGFMVPLKIEIMALMPKNPNGKIDRKQLVQDFSSLFE